jgi:arylsulfatase A-like enzyme
MERHSSATTSRRICASIRPRAKAAAPDGALQVRTERYKYVVFNSGQRPEQFYDLLTDPGETVNLAASTASLLEQHPALLSAELRRTADAFAPFFIKSP